MTAGTEFVDTLIEADGNVTPTLLALTGKALRHEIELVTVFDVINALDEETVRIALFTCALAYAQKAGDALRGQPGYTGSTDTDEEEPTT